MARIKAILNAFTGGEVAPNVWGRTEADQWPTMLEEMRNVISDPRGGAKRRDGLHYVLPTKFPQLNSRLIPFVFSREQSYMLEFGNYYVRFYRDQGYVEDVGNVQTYLGDGTSTKFVYPYPDVLEADIVVYDKNGDLIPDTNYTVSTIDTGFNYLPAFSDASWNVDTETSGQPWVKNAAQITSPDGYETVMGAMDVPVPLGGEYKYSVDIIDVTLTKTTKTDTDATDITLTSDADFISVAQLTAELEHETDMTLNYDVTFQDAVQDSDFYWELRHNSAVLASGTELAVGAVVARVQGQTVLTDRVYIGDTATLQVRAVGNNPTSVPVVAGTVNATTLTGSFTTNPDAKLQYDITPFNDSTIWNDIDTTAGTKVLLDTTSTSTEPAPMDFVYRCQNGVQVTLENPSLTFNNDGYVLTFNTAPALGDIILIKDSSSATAKTVELPNQPPFHPVTNPEGGTHPVVWYINKEKLGRHLLGHKASAYAAAQATDIFEIQSPFSAEDLEDLHFAQANDVMTFAHDRHKPWTLTRYDPYDWRFEQPTLTGAPWEDGAYNPLNGYPRTVVYFQERLYFGGTFAKPQTLWGSRAADFYDFTVPVPPTTIVPDDPVEYTIAAYTHEAIEWLSSERVLVIGTSSTEHRLAPDQYIATDRLPTVSRMSAFGGAHVMPAFMGNLTCFVQASGESVRTFEQSGQSIIEKWDSIELDWMASHLTKPKVKQLGYALMHDSLLFMVTLDGDFLTMTYEPGQGDKGEMGWGKHSTDGNFKSCAVIPEDDYDEIWAIVEREIEGVPQRYVEFFDKTVFTDSTLTYPPDDGTNYPPLQQVGGLGHLEGKTVTIVGDGATHPDMTVENGQVTLNNYYSKIEIGLKYIPRIKLQRFAMASQPANLQGQMGRWVEVWLRLVESAYPLVDGKRAAERSPMTEMNVAQPIVTDDVKVYHLGFDRNKQLIIEQDLPMPMHITAVYGVMEVNPE